MLWGWRFDFLQGGRHSTGTPCTLAHCAVAGDCLDPRRARRVARTTRCGSTGVCGDLLHWCRDSHQLSWPRHARGHQRASTLATLGTPHILCQPVSDSVSHNVACSLQHAGCPLYSERMLLATSASMHLLHEVRGWQLRCDPTRLLRALQQRQFCAKPLTDAAAHMGSTHPRSRRGESARPKRHGLTRPSSYQGASSRRAGKSRVILPKLGSHLPLPVPALKLVGAARREARVLLIHMDRALCKVWRTARLWRRIRRRMSLGCLQALEEAVGTAAR